VSLFSNSLLEDLRWVLKQELEDTSRVDLLICTLISGNQILEKSRSVSNLRKISGSANLDFFSRLRLYYKSQKNPGDKLKKNPGLQDLKIF
jgi:hypothetical protein